MSRHSRPSLISRRLALGDPGAGRFVASSWVALQESGMMSRAIGAAAAAPALPCSTTTDSA